MQNTPINIIIPLGGKGERFVKEGYTVPKALISIYGKPMFANVIDNLGLYECDNLIVIYNNTLDDHHFQEYIQTHYPNIILIRLENPTSGAAETVKIGLSYIIENKPTITLHKKTLLLDCDTIYTDNIVEIFRNSIYSAVFYTEKTDEPPIYSYISMDDDSKIVDIAEKQKISCYANTGAYGFSDVNELLHYCKTNKITYNNEPYTSCVIKTMLLDNIIFHGYPLRADHVFSVGTPRELENYFAKTRVFLFDLDGTLVVTDDIYFEVWRKILKSYEGDLTREMFNKYIQGNNDQYVIHTLLPSVCIDLKTLSAMKDNLFLQNMDKIKIIDGVKPFFENIYKKGNKSCIVTNCNSLVAKSIVDILGISKHVDFIISSEDCSQCKPHPEPYLQAMKKFGVQKNRTYIFEDSKTGILSGKSARPMCLIGVETIYTRDELLNHGVDMTITDYKDLDIQTLIEYNGFTTEKLESYVKNSVDFDCSFVKIDADKLKGGFIADVIRVSLIHSNDGESVTNCVLKLENTNVTSLSKMATQLQLYEREYYFYENISKYIKSVRIPKCIGLVKDDELRTIGVLLENMYLKGNYAPNLNLNTTDINVSLKIVDKMARLHAQFWNRPLQSGFPQLKTTMDAAFYPFCYDYICERWDAFVSKWEKVLTPQQIEIGCKIKSEFCDIQRRLSSKNTTLVHGDIKSPNIFYDLDNGNDPVFLDWQHCVIGKGVQDLAFFIIESFDIDKLAVFYPIFKNYYYCKLMEYGIKNYSVLEYENDLRDAFCYVPFFTAVWFGTVSYDELIDKNFPFFFIQKLFVMLEMAN